jgi:hypothetical protein
MIHAPRLTNEGVTMRRTALATLAVGVLAIAGCGDSGDDGTSRDEQVTTVMQAVADADTPSAVCTVMSSGFRFFVGDGSDSEAACRDHVVDKLGPLTRAKDVQVDDIREEDGQVIVHATLDGQTTDYFFVQQDGDWKLNSIGVRQGLGPDPTPED